VNDNPRRDREQPETDAERLDEDELLISDELEAEGDIPEFLDDDEESEAEPGPPSFLRPVPLSSIFTDQPLGFGLDDPDDDEEPQIEEEPPLEAEAPAAFAPEAEVEEDELDEEALPALAEVPQQYQAEPAYEVQQPAGDGVEDETQRYGYDAEPEATEEPVAALAAEPVDELQEEIPLRQAPRSLPAFQPAGRGGNAAQPQVFTLFKPDSNRGGLIGVAFVLFCLVVGAALVYKSFQHDPSLAQFFPLVVGPLLLSIGALFAYWTWGALSLRYVVDRNALTIRWGAQKQIVPLLNIERLIPADPDGEEPDIQGVDWPGHHVGRARVPSLGEVLFYSGHRSSSDILYVQTSSDTYAISVPDAVAFAQVVQANQMRGSLFEQRQAVHRDGIAAQSFWIDPQARFLTVILLGAFVAVLAYVLQMYPDLARSVPLRFPALGGLLRVTDKSELLDIPRSAAAFLGLNLVLAIVLHPWERMVSIVLLLAGIAIQVALLVAAIVAVA
jgi:hypothetical protein